MTMIERTQDCPMGCEVRVRISNEEYSAWECSNCHRTWTEPEGGELTAVQPFLNAEVPDGAAPAAEEVDSPKVVMTVLEEYASPRKCGDCGKVRKVVKAEQRQDDSTFTAQLCRKCLANRSAHQETVLDYSLDNDDMPTHPADIAEAVSTALAQGTDVNEAVNQPLNVTRAQAASPAVNATEKPKAAPATDAPATLGPLGPGKDEALPKTFTDEIRKRLAAQHVSGATFEQLAGAWGRSVSSVKIICQKFPTG